MSTSSFEEGSMMAGHHATSSGLESTTSLLFSLPSDASDVQTETTPPTSPTPSESECTMCTPKDFLDASRRRRQIQISALAFQGSADVTPTRPSKQFHRRTPSQVVANDEAGYDADGDGDGEGNADADADADGNERALADIGAGTIARTRPICRPAFLRIDTRQHRRVASMLATHRPMSPGPDIAFGNTDDAVRQPRATSKLAVALPSIRLLKSKPSTTTAAGNVHNVVSGECYELRRRPRAELVGLGIGFPENHPLRSRAFSMPVPCSASPMSDPDEPDVEGGKKKEHGVVVEGQASEAGWRPGWPSAHLPTRSVQMHREMTTAQGGMYEPCPVRMTLRPTFLEVSPSPIKCLPAWDGGAVGALRYDGVHERSEIMTERERYRALAREGRLKADLS